MSAEDNKSTATKAGSVETPEEPVIPPTPQPQPVEEPAEATAVTIAGFASDAVCQYLDTSAILPTQTKLYRLPGAAPDNGGNNRISGMQVIQLIVPWVSKHYPSKTWVDGISQLRNDAKLSATDHDWKACNWVSNQWARENAPLNITDDQEDGFIRVYVQALAGRVPHWDAGIQANIVGLDVDIRKMLLLRWSALVGTTQGDFQSVRKLTEWHLGRITPRTNPATMPDASGAMALGDLQAAVDAGSF